MGSQKKRVKLPWQMYCVIGELPVDEVLPVTSNTDNGRTPFIINGQTYLVNMYSLRYETFKKSKYCIACGLEGTIMRLEMTKGSIMEHPHFNLYGPNREGHLILFTKDHIIPKSKGGEDHENNLQTMCTDCNSKKGSLLPEEYHDRYMIGPRLQSKKEELTCSLE